MINAMFATTHENRPESDNGRGFAETNQLNKVANVIAELILNEIAGCDNDSSLYNNFELSKTSPASMTSLIERYDYMSYYATDSCLADTSSETLERMLKSQQSKRSRLKGSVMTAHNYKALLTASICEAILRSIMGKQAGTISIGVGAGALEPFTDEELNALAEDQTKLQKLIRGIQSKKSVYRVRFDADMEGPYWNSLLAREEQLKSLRPTPTRAIAKQSIIIDDSTRVAIKGILEPLENYDAIDRLRSTDAKEYVRRIYKLIMPAMQDRETYDVDTDTAANNDDNAAAV
jgi:hypothetical protein